MFIAKYVTVKWKSCAILVLSCMFIRAGVPASQPAAQTGLTRPIFSSHSLLMYW
jgi:hypothetical protein